MQMQRVSKERAYLGVIAVLAVAVVALFLLSQTRMPREADIVKELYNILTERETDILSVKEESGLYKVTVKFIDAVGRTTVQDVYLTKDGVLFANSLVNIRDFMSRLNIEKNFSLCMASQNVRLLGQGNDLQVFQQLLGSFAGRVYFDCAANDQNLQQCQQAGIQRIPAMLYNNTIYEGFRDVSFVSSLMGCTM